MASTMIFCTGYLSDETSWEQRYERWLAHHKKVFPEASFFIIDDGSPFLPTNPRVSIKSDLSDLTAADYANFFHFPNRLGRRTVTDFPGWFRSFTFSVSIARKLGYSKIVHIESDAFALTRRAAQYVETREDGWVAFYCPRYRSRRRRSRLFAATQLRRSRRSGIRHMRQTTPRNFSNCPCHSHMSRQTFTATVMANSGPEFPDLPISAHKLTKM